jgi:hypothetical protein
MKMLHSGRTTVATLIFAAALATPAFAVDGVTLISQTNTTTFPIPITASGSYRLASDLNVPASQNGIQISASDVTLDLNGFTILCSGCVGNTGVSISAGPGGVTLTNGIIAGFGLAGVGAASGQYGVLPSVKLDHVRLFYNGIGASTSTALLVITECTLDNNHTAGVIADSALRVTNSEIDSNYGPGIQAFAEATISGSSITNNNGAGIALYSGLVTGNKIDSNTQDGVDASQYASITNNSILMNGGSGIGPWGAYDPGIGYGGNTIMGNRQTVQNTGGMFSMKNNVGPAGVF